MSQHSRAEPSTLIKLDIGSGGFKRPGYTGIDRVPEADLVCDIETERWPIADNSVSRVFSSHCFEHIRNESWVHVLAQTSRVCADGAQIEIWHPYAFHNEAHIMGHVNTISEDQYLHFCASYQDTWAGMLGARWYLDEIRYHVEVEVQRGLEAAGIPVAFAIRHLNNVVSELGIFATIEKGREKRSPHGFRRIVVDSDPPTNCRDTRNLNPRPLDF